MLSIYNYIWKWSRDDQYIFNFHRALTIIWQWPGDQSSDGPRDVHEPVMR